MKNRGGALGFEAYIDDTEFNKAVERMNRKVSGMSDVALKETKRMEAGFSSLGVAVGGLLTFAAAKGFISTLVRIRGEFQMLEIAFETMLKSKEKADKLMKEIIEFAATTPYGLQQTSSAAKQLIAYGESAETVISTLRKLGDIASGINAPLGDIAYLYGTTMTQGRLYTQDLNQFTGRGIPMIKELAKQFGVAESEVKKLVESGKVGFEEVRRVIDNLTSSGSMFGGLMEKQSKSIPGQIEQLHDAWDQMINNLGKKNEGLITHTIAGLTTVIENYEEVGKILAALIATYGSYRAALMAVAVAQRISASLTYVDTIQKMTGAGVQLVQVTKKLTLAQYAQIKAQAALNAVMSVNPYAALFAAVAGIVTIMWAFHDSTTAVEKAQERISGLEKELAESKEDLISKTNRLNGEIRDQTSTEYSRLKAYKQLQGLYPSLLSSMDMHEYMTIGLTEAQKLLNKEADKFSLSRLEIEYKKAQEEVERTKGIIESLASAGIPDMLRKQRKQYEEAIQYEAQIKALLEQEKRIAEEALLTEDEKIRMYKDELSVLQAQREELETALLLSKGVGNEWGSTLDIIRSISLGKINEQIQSIQTKLSNLSGSDKDRVKDKSYWEGEKNKATEIFEKSLPGTDEFIKAKKAIIEADNELKKWNATAEKTKEIFPSGSLAEIDRQIKNANETLSKIPADQVDRIRKMHEVILNLTKMRAEAERNVEFKTFQKTLDDKRVEYEEFERALETGGRYLTEKAYQKLLKEGRSYVEYLNKIVAPLEDKMKKNGFDSLTDDEASMYLSIKKELSEATGASSSIDIFNKKLEEAQSQSGNLSEYLRILQAELKSLDGDFSGTGIRKAHILKERIGSTKGELKEVFKSFLNEYNLFNTKIRGVELETEDLINEARRQLKGKDLENAITAINKEKDERIKAINDELITRSEAYKKVHEEALYWTREEFNQRIALIDKILSKEENISDELKLHLQILRRGLISNRDVQGIDNMRKSLNALRGAFSVTGSDMSKSLSDAFEAADSLMNAIQGIKEMKSSGGKDPFSAIPVLGWISSFVFSIGSAISEAQSQGYGFLDRQRDTYNKLFNRIEGINLLLDRQEVIIDRMYGNEKYAEMIKYYKTLREQMEGTFSALKGAEFEVFLNMPLSSKAQGYLEDLYRRVGIITDDIVRSLQNPDFLIVDTSGFETIEDYKDLLVKIKTGYYGDLNFFEDDIKALEDLIKQWDELDKKMKETKDAIDQFFTGTTIESIADSIVEGFAQGERTVEQFSARFEDMMTNSLKRIFKANIMDASLQQYYDMFSSFATSDFMLTEDEINQLRGLWDSLIEESARKWEAFEKITGNFTNTQDPMVGALKGLSEDTGNIIAGQITALRMSQAQATEYIRQQLLHLSSINTNTSALPDFLWRLESIDNSLKRMNDSQWWRDMGVAN